ncbi:MAG: ABC transporter permease [Acetobacteraceae bacterium]|nr:ABC transporter permease [Acetobacteraceae bacterium]
MLSTLAIQALTGLASASSLFLVASGLSVIFGVTRVVNFAHGSLCMLGAYLGWSVLSRLPHDPASFAAGVVMASLGVALFGAALEATLLRRLYRAPALLQLLATFAVLLVMQDGVQHIWGPADLPLPRGVWLRSFVPLLGERFPFYDLILIAIGPLVLLALWMVMARTRFGVLLRAATENRDMLSALGVDERFLFTAVFALGAGLAGLGGALSLPENSANLGIDLRVVTDAFVVVVVGGMGSIAGAYLAAVLVGVMQAMGILLLPKASLVLVFVLMALVLVLRPQGVLGQKQTQENDGERFHRVRAAPPWQRIAGLAVVLLALAVGLAGGDFARSVLEEMAIAVLFAASLHVLLGPGGMISFGHAAWFGIGAYAVALTTSTLAAPLPLALLAGVLAAGAVAAIVGLVLVRLSGVSLAMLTLAFAQIAWAVATQWSEVTGGDDGILGIWPPSGLGARLFFLLCLCLSVGGVLLLRRALFAPFGYALRASRDAASRAAASGIDGAKLRLAAFALAGAAAGLAGGLSTFSKGSVFPGSLAIFRSVDALAMVLLGGVQSMVGPVVGALAYTGLFDTLLLASDYWRALLGITLLALILWRPQGLVK